MGENILIKIKNTGKDTSFRNTIKEQLGDKMAQCFILERTL